VRGEAGVSDGHAVRLRNGVRLQADMRTASVDFSGPLARREARNPAGSNVPLQGSIVVQADDMSSEFPAPPARTAFG
jgi:hypothetical protein